MARLAFDVAGRQIHWEISEDMAASLLQYFVQNLGPAEEGGL